VTAERWKLTHACLDEGRAAAATGAASSGATRPELTALAQAKLAFAGHLLELCAARGLRAFASIVDRDAGPAGS